MSRFRDRADAGRRLASSLVRLQGEDVVVLGVPRGGVPVAAEVARLLGAPLDVILVRKLGLPFQAEMAMGAIGEGGARVLNEGAIRSVGLTESQVKAVESRERVELERRATRYRKQRGRVPLVGRTAIVVDDGIATGSTARAACEVARSLGAARVVLATPVAPMGSIVDLRASADEVVCLLSPVSFFAVGEWYDDFEATSDEEVVELLDAAAARLAASSEGHP